MNILITSPSLEDQGGVANFYNTILPVLEEKEELHLSHIEIGSTHGTKRKRIFKFLYPLIDQINFYKRICREQFDIIHLNPSLDLKGFLREGIMLYVAKKRHLRVVVFFHGWDENFEKVIEEKLWWFFRKTYSKAEAFIVLGLIFEKKLRKWGITVPIFRLTTAINEQFLKEFSIEDKIEAIKNAVTIKILFLARIEIEKGIIETLKAVKILAGKGYLVTLSIAGDGSAMNKVRDFIRQYNFGKNEISLLGYIRGKEKKTALSSHHIYCFPTYYKEGLPTSLLEAMFFGMPVIITSVGGIKDFFEHGGMGYILDSKDPEKIADFLEQLITNKAKMVEMALFNHEYAKKNFSGVKVAEELNDIYKKMI